MHKNKKLYRCFGYEITIDQAAECACVSVAAVRSQLTKLGGNMETVMQMYERRYGGVIARMEQMMEYDADKRAAKDIMAALGFMDDEEIADEAGQMAEAAITEPEVPEANAIPLAENAGIMILPEEEPEPEKNEPRIMFAPIEVDDSGDRKELTLLNNAIEALEKLEEVEIVEEYAGVMREDVLNKLKDIRMNGYEHLINWRAIAEGK